MIIIYDNHTERIQRQLSQMPSLHRLCQINSESSLLPAKFTVFSLINSYEHLKRQSRWKIDYTRLCVSVCLSAKRMAYSALQALTAGSSSCPLFLYQLGAFSLFRLQLCYSNFQR